MELPRVQLARLLAAPARVEPVVRARHAQVVPMTQHLHADADQQALLAPHRLDANGPGGVEEMGEHAVQNAEQEHDQRERDVVRQQRGEQHRAHRHVDDEHEKLVRQVLRDPVDGRDPIGQVADQPVGKELHRQPQQPRQTLVVADDRDANRKPLQEAVPEQGQEIHEDAAAEQGRHQRAPTPPVFQNVVHEDAQGYGNDERQQGQHERAGDRPRQHAPFAGEQGAQLRQQAGPLAAGPEAVAALESQRNSAVAPGELRGGNPAAPRGRVVQIDEVALEPFDDEEMAELPEHDQRQLQPVEQLGPDAQSAGLEAVVPGGAHDARGAAAVPAHLAPFPQLGERNPAPEVAQHHAEAGGAAFRRMHLQQNRRGYPLRRSLRRSLAVCPIEDAGQHPRTA